MDLNNLGQVVAMGMGMGMAKTAEWIPVTKEWPNLGENGQSEIVLTFGPEGIRTGFLEQKRTRRDGIDYFLNQWEVDSTGCGCCDLENIEVTHWMPLPKPPKF